MPFHCTPATSLIDRLHVLFCVLHQYFAPNILNNEMPAMREMVDKHFNDNFIITSYMVRGSP